MNVTPVNLAFEDSLSEAVMEKIVVQYGAQLAVGNKYSKGGFGYLRKGIKGFNQAAKVIPFLVMTDLDKYDCPPNLIKDWLNVTKHPQLLLWVAVRETETWLLADREGFSGYIRLDKSHIPVNVEDITNPKEFLINLVRKSNKRSIMQNIIPKPGTTATQGRNYNGTLINFVNQYWSTDRARNISPSLNRAIKCVEKFKE